MDIEQWLASHDGVASRAQARACGVSEDRIARKVASGEWLRRAPGGVLRGGVDVDAGRPGAGGGKGARR